ncbi:hypothetical protein HYPSUDRAFT_200301 [Hypholoma sublateritium FD-334 SS-4]|uniref:Uncharacterized protein n=1 Tax=Hypholoma sublateritium (strain FD-334 SS-4) TaxID=945553 RepID=A0A0D2LC07_HYPSF|nr:hypothetical protein HYPSUDRAFT_200301 [Hypholoma sublateritium FD-334 SS-4]
MPALRVAHRTLSLSTPTPYSAQLPSNHSARAPCPARTSAARQQDTKRDEAYLPRTVEVIWAHRRLESSVAIAERLACGVRTPVNLPRPASRSANVHEYSEGGGDASEAGRVSVCRPCPASAHVCSNSCDAPPLGTSIVVLVNFNSGVHY